MIKRKDYRETWEHLIKFMNCKHEHKIIGKIVQEKPNISITELACKKCN